MKFLGRLNCLLFGHTPVIVYSFDDVRFGCVDLCESCWVYYKEEE